MTVRVSRRTPPADDAAKARTIAADRGALLLHGDARHLRKVRDLLAELPEVVTFLGRDERGTWLYVAGPGGGGWAMDRVG